jgi:hypothetical protein
MSRTITIACIVLLLAAAIPASAETLLEIGDLREGDMEMVGFELPKGADVTIEAVGLQTPYSDKLAVYAWLLDHSTRELIWVMSNARSDTRTKGKPLRFAEKVKHLDPGKYELYMYAGNVWNTEVVTGSKDFFEVLGQLVDDEEEYNFDDRDFQDYMPDCYVKLNSDDITKAEVKEFKITGEIPGSVLQLVGLGDDEYLRKEFTLDEPMNIKLYSILELPSGYKAPVDGGWIVNADTREKVWQMDRWNTERAGGAKKNRKFDDEVRLDKGRYILYYSTDDSHSFDQFNQAPPYDPACWGITVLPGKDFKASSFHLVAESQEAQPLVDLTKAGNNDYFEQPFELKKAMPIRLYVLGEFSDSDGEFADYGWIEDLNSGKMAWTMDDHNSEYAGGADKNRMFDGIVDLPAGKYMACYVTDGSHAYRDWNLAQPFDPAAWGLAIYPGKGFDNSQFVLLSEDQAVTDSKFLARLTRVVDREHRRAKFTLSKPTKVSVYAIGEYSSRDREFVDYGWIEDATGKTVWEMTRRNTEHAGGAEKNRMANDTVLLEPGEYRVFYETDGSHAFNEWNEERPDDPINWGITVTAVEGS